MARVLTTVEAVRAQFSALKRDQVFFDAPGGTQVPDSVIDAIAGYLRDENANLGGPFETSRLSDALIARAHAAAVRRDCARSASLRRLLPKGPPRFAFDSRR